MSEATNLRPAWADQKAYEDPETFRHGTEQYKLTEAEQETLLAWIRDNISPAKTEWKGYTSYQMKSLFETASDHGKRIGFYITNGHFKGAMRAAGFEPINPSEINWRFRVRRTTPQPQSGSFLEWLLKRRNQDNPVGDLAQDAARDRTFPNGDTTRDALLSYLVHRGASIPAREAAQEAWKSYERHQKRHSRQATLKTPPA